MYEHERKFFLFSNFSPLEDLGPGSHLPEVCGASPPIVRTHLCSFKIETKCLFLGPHQVKGSRMKPGSKKRAEGWKRGREVSRKKGSQRLSEADSTWTEICLPGRKGNFIQMYETTSLKGVGEKGATLGNSGNQWSLQN